MKKIYLLLALAAATVSTGFAAQKGKAITIGEQSKANTEIVSTANINVDGEATKTRASFTREDFISTYNLVYGFYTFGDTDQWGGSFTFEIMAGQGADEVILTGIPYRYLESENDPLLVKGTVDLTTGEVKFPKQQVGMIGDSPMIFTPTLWTQKDNGNFSMDVSYDGPLVLKLKADGSGFEQSLMGYNLMNGAKEGYGWGGIGVFIKADKPTWFAFNQYEWKKADQQVDFQDDGFMSAWFTNAQLEVPGPSKVDLYVNRENQNQYLLMNPYASSDAWKSYPHRPADAENGYIIFDVSDPYCVPMMVTVNSGFYDEDGDQTYTYNTEGNYYYNLGWSTEAIQEQFLPAGVALSEYDEDTHMVTLTNLYWGYHDDTLAGYCWVTDDGNGNRVPAATFIYITMPENITFSGINDVEMNENAPVRYFNLQGMEVVNPVKGQLVIKTQGNKAQKVIVK